MRLLSTTLLTHSGMYIHPKCDEFVDRAAAVQGNCYLKDSIVCRGGWVHGSRWSEGEHKPNVRARRTLIRWVARGEKIRQENIWLLLYVMAVLKASGFHVCATSSTWLCVRIIYIMSPFWSSFHIILLLTPLASRVLPNAFPFHHEPFKSVLTSLLSYNPCTGKDITYHQSSLRNNKCSSAWRFQRRDISICMGRGLVDWLVGWLGVSSSWVEIARTSSCNPFREREREREFMKELCQVLDGGRGSAWTESIGSRIMLVFSSLWHRKKERARLALPQRERK